MNRSHEIDELRARLSRLIDRSGVGDDARAVASEALEELAVVIEEIQAQNSELVESRRDLEAERRRYRDLFDTVPDGYVITDLDGMITEANSTACALFGRDRSQMVGKPIAVYVDGVDRGAFYTHLNRIRRATTGTQFAINLTVRDHVRIPANLRATASGSASDDLTQIRWLIHDRRADIESAELRESEERLRALFDTATIGIVLCEGDDDIVFINRYAAALLEYPRMGPAAPNWLHAIPDDDLPAVREAIHAARHDGDMCSIRHRLVHDDGSAHWVEHHVAPFRNGHGAVTGCVSTLADVTAEHEAMTQLQASRDFTAALLDTVGALVVVLSPDWTVLRFNTACERLTGRRAGDVVGHSMVDVLVPVDQRDAVSETLAALFVPGASNTFENDWLAADGTPRRISWTNTNITGPDGRVSAVIGTGIDVTDQRLLEWRVAQVARLEAIGRLTAGIAHDFNNTLAALRLRIERLAARRLDDDDLVDVEAATRTIDRTQVLIGDLLSFGSRQDLRPAPTDINAEVVRLTDLMSDILGPGTDVVLELAPIDLVAYVDPGRFEQILTNLVLNARDAMPDGGTLKIATALDVIETGTDRRAGPSSSGSPVQLATGGYVKVSVSDTGVGIRAADLEHVFDPYFTTKPAAQGTGLGLATTYGTIVQSGGTIVADSDVGVGTTMTIWLPQHDQLDASALAPIHGSTGRVLVVDDDPDVRDVLADELRHLGYETIEACTGAHALEHLDVHLDALLIDVHLPDSTGVRLATQFRLRQPDVRIVFMSGAPAQGLRDTLPPDAVLLEKPFTTDQLAAAIEGRS